MSGDEALCKLGLCDGLNETANFVYSICKEHEEQIKAKDEKIERLTIRLKLIKEMSDVNEKIIKAKDEEIKELGEIVQQYLIPSKNYDAIIRYKDEEIVKLKLELFRSSPKITNKKARSIVAMLFWRARKDKRLADEENKFFTYDIALHSFIIFRQAHKMLKDNL